MWVSTFPLAHTDLCLLNIRPISRFVSTPRINTNHHHKNILQLTAVRIIMRWTGIITTNPTAILSSNSHPPIQEGIFVLTWTTTILTLAQVFMNPLLSSSLRLLYPILPTVLSRIHLGTWYHVTPPTLVTQMETEDTHGATVEEVVGTKNCSLHADATWILVF